ncbi:flavodoxin [Paenibacillus sp. BR2-3]|uniref:flavodoxin n=1 Tax=Paenibacillus sp. BR2-3 TaxID=3048494 RepID=UPI003977D2D0
MKRTLAVILSVFMIVALAACGNNDNPSADNTTKQPPVSDTSTPESPDEGTSGTEVTPTESRTNGKILIAYFTMPKSDGVDAVASASRVVKDGEVLGNTQFIAQAIQKTVGGDLFAIETVQEYPGDHDELVDFAEREQDEKVRPELSTHVEKMDDYDVILLGYPNWWADLPMPLYSFLEEYDLSGKKIIPFATHDGSRFSRTIRTIEDLQPNATVVEDGLTVSRNSIVDAEDDVNEWVQSLGITE